MPRYQVKIDDGTGRLVPFTLGTDDKGLPLYTSHLLPPVSISVYSQGEEARYASTVPGVGSVFAQTDLSGGMGKKLQVRREDADFDRYYYTEYLDLSVPGQGQKGPNVVTLTAPANSDKLTGAFVLGGTPYLILGRIVVSWGGTGSDVLSQTKDFGAGIVGRAAAVWQKAAAETQDIAHASTTTSALMNAPDDYCAQQFRPSTTGTQYLSNVRCILVSGGTPTGDVRVRIQTDHDGHPSGVTIATARRPASDITATPGGGNYTFRFDDDETVALVQDEPLWLVVDCAGTSAANTISWYCSSTSGYSAGFGATSDDGGNSWTNLGSSSDFYFQVYTKVTTATAYVGKSTASSTLLFSTTTDGTTFTDDAYRRSSALAIVGDRLVRDAGTANISSRGSIEWSSDGTNWSDALVIGDVTMQVVTILAMGDIALVVKTDSIWAVDMSTDAFDVQQLTPSTGTTTATNGLGATVWRNVAYVPFNGRLVAIEGDFTNGFTVHGDVGPSAFAEWDAPWGSGRVCAVAGDRFHLYAILSATGGYRLLKAANPLRTKPAASGGGADPDWHGSLATLGDGTQTIEFCWVHDAGGTTNPELFFSLTGNNVGRIRLPRSANPASDANYSYDTSSTGDLYFSRATGNYPVHPKAWLTETVTFAQSRPNDYVEIDYDTLDGESWRRLSRGRLYDTGARSYPRGTSSQVLARRLHLVNSVSTASPLLLAFGASYAVRHLPGAAIREISFSVIAEDALAGGGADLGEGAALSAGAQRALVQAAAGLGLGTRRLEDPYGRVWDRVLFLDATEVLQSFSRDGVSSSRSLIQISAVAIA